MEIANLFDTSTNWTCISSERKLAEDNDRCFPHPATSVYTLKFQIIMLFQTEHQLRLNASFVQLMTACILLPHVQLFCNQAVIYYFSPLSTNSVRRLSVNIICGWHHPAVPMLGLVNMWALNRKPQSHCSEYTIFLANEPCHTTMPCLRGKGFTSSGRWLIWKKEKKRKEQTTSVTHTLSLSILDCIQTVSICQCLSIHSLYLSWQTLTISNRHTHTYLHRIKLMMFTWHKSQSFNMRKFT